MANIFSLFGTIFIDNEKANKEIDKTTGKAESGGSKIKDGFAKAAKGAMVAGTAIVGAATGIAAGAMKMAGDTTVATDRIDKMSQKLSMSRQGFQEWDYIMSQSGMTIDSAGTAMKSLTNAMASLEEGGKIGEETLKKLGITTEDLKNKSQEQIFEQSIKALTEMPEGYEKMAIAQQLFGRQAQELAPIINGQAGVIDDLKKEARELGLVMGDDIIDAGVKFGDTMDAIKLTGARLMNQVGGALLPIIQEVLDMVMQHLPFIQQTFKQLVPIISQVFSGFLPPLMELAQMLLPVIIDLIMEILPVVIEIISSILPVITNLLQMLLPPIIEIVKMLLPLLLNLIKPLMPLLDPILMLLSPLIELLMMILEPLVELLNMILPPIIKVIVFLIDMALKPLQGALEIVAKILGGAFKLAFDGIKNYITTVVNVFKGIIDFVKNVFTGNWKGAWEAVKNIFSSIFDGIKAAFKLPINWIIDGLNVFIRGLNKLKIPDWVPGVGGKGFTITEFKKLKTGIEYVPYDEYPALLHRGEKVVPAGQAENARRTEPQAPATQRASDTLNFNINIAEFVNNRKQDVEELVEEILTIAEDKRRRQREVYA